LSPEDLTRSAAGFVSAPGDSYHLAELRVGLDPSNPAHSLPPIVIGDKVLDIGCGAGQTLIAACAYREPGEGGLCVSCSRRDCPTWGYGIDVDERALSLGRKWSQRMVLDKAFAESLPFADDEFDMIVSRVALAYTNLPVAAREMRRVLRPGGRLWLTLHPFSMLIHQAKEPKNWKGWLHLGYVALNGVLLHFTLRQMSLFGKCETWQTPSGMKRLLEKSGFTAVEVSSTERCFLVTAQG